MKEYDVAEDEVEDDDDVGDDDVMGAGEEDRSQDLGPHWVRCFAIEMRLNMS